jgi:uncharacterized membrane protein YedE/YeeE
MNNFTPIAAAVGGALIGLAAVLLMMLTGRVAGISGIFGGLLSLPSSDTTQSDKIWRIAFIAGLILAPLTGTFVGHALAEPQLPASWPVVVVAGLLVGIGTRIGSGCTSGHGVCGIARLSPRSIVATMIFMAAAIVTVALTHHVFGA